jgi:hypothetical protein
MDYDNAEKRAVYFNRNEGIADSDESEMISRMGLDKTIPFIVLLSELEGPPSDVRPIMTGPRLRRSNHPYCYHQAPLDMTESDYVPIYGQALMLRVDEKTVFGRRIRTKGDRLADYLTDALMSIDGLFETEDKDGYIHYHLQDESMQGANRIRTHSSRWDRIEVRAIRIDSYCPSDIIRQAMVRILEFNNGKLPKGAHLKGEHKKGFAFRPNFSGKTIDDIMKSPDVLF